MGDAIGDEMLSKDAMSTPERLALEAWAPCTRLSIKIRCSGFKHSRRLRVR